MLPREPVPHPADVEVLSAPATAPRLRIVTSAGRCVALELSDASSPFRGSKPAEAVAATVLSYAGDEPPAEPGQWRFECSTSRTTFNVQLDPTIAPGTTVWLTAHWFNTREDAGPLCTPVAAHRAAETMTIPPRRLAA